ncbi:unnamed protein product [Phytophthora fragariaefolia]|uniref:Unnamed protein product n=1 Tax=Phytophthora fragariaefolia TaxID=1490495 RepID=A0A9W6U9S9_9STRA|nr:unnamed protein product [Phytophthora fragariaefolia]
MDAARSAPLTPQHRPPVPLRLKPRAESVRAPKPRPIMGGEPQLNAQQEAEQEQEHEQEQKQPEPAAGPRRRERSGSMKTRRPLGGKLKIDVDAAEMAAPPVVGSPLGYFPSKKQPSIAHEDHPVSVFTAAESHAGSGLLASASPFLEYGMVVSLVCDDRGGVVAAEGFASRDVRLERLSYGAEAPMTRLGLGGMAERRMFEESGLRLLSCPFRDCLFEVVPKMTYDATIALSSLIDAGGKSPRRPSSQHTLDNLRFKSEAETRLNAMMYKKLKGTQVIYGQVR